MLALLMIAAVSIVNTAAGQRIGISGADLQFLTEKTTPRLSKAQLQSAGEFFGPDEVPVRGVLGSLSNILENLRNDISRPEVTSPTCDASAEAVIEAEKNDPMPEGYKLRQGGTLKRLGNLLRLNANHGIGSDSANKTSSKTTSGGDSLSADFVDTFVIVQSPHGNYYTIDIWGTYIEVSIVYPIDPDAEYFSRDPDENDIRNAIMRLFDLSVNGRLWNETPQQFFQRATQSTGTLSCTPPETSEKVTIRAVQSSDPNDKLGPVGVGENRYIAADTDFDYVIRFENKQEATAPAQEVLIRDTLDTTVFDLTTLQLREITFGDARISVPRGRSSFSTRVPLVDPLELLVDVHLVPETGVLTWRFVTIDTNTSELPVNPLEGFLPPNVTSPEGEGSVSFFVRLKDGISDATAITNQAQIFFDLNEPIDTPPWSNTIDSTPPASAITGLANEQPDSSFAVTWGGSDAGAGISTYDVFFAVNGGEFKRWLTRTRLTEQDFAGVDDSTYSFFSIAYDAAGNIEGSKSVADATTAVNVGIGDSDEYSGLPLTYELDNAFPNPTTTRATIRYALPEAGPVSIAVYNIQGREVLSVVTDATRSAGWHTEAVDVRHLASGVYVYRMTAGNARIVRKMTVIR